MRHVVADIETDNLLDALTRVWCLVLRDRDTGMMVSCTDSAPDEWYVGHDTPTYRRARLAEGYAILRNAERVYWHNGIKFDFPALVKVNGVEPHPRSAMRDTLVLASMRFAHIQKQDWDNVEKGFPQRWCGSHTLEAWGYRLGMHKGDYSQWCKQQGLDPWSEWRPEMQSYAEQDVVLGSALVDRINEARFSPEAAQIEHELAWYLAVQERCGVPFDKPAAERLTEQLIARRAVLEQTVREAFGWWYEPDGDVQTFARTVRKQNGEPCLKLEGAPYQKIKVVEFNPGSRQQIAKRLTKLYGWEPLELTKTGLPKVDDVALKALDQTLPGVAALTEYLLVEKRLGQIAEGEEAWLHHARLNPETGLFHIHGRVKQNHAITHRAAHSTPNLGQVPKVDSKYGPECRAMFMVPPGWVMVGADASGLEARNLGHYMAAFDGGAYAKVLLDGDVHSVNRDALGLPSTTNAIAKHTRGGSKNWFYAFMYGGGDEKLGKMLAMLRNPETGEPYIKPPKGGWTKDSYRKLGKQLKAKFLKNTPALGKLVEKCKKAFKEKGWLRMPDGRRTYIRSDHSSLNSLLQAAGAIICKKWIVNFAARLREEFGEPGWGGMWVPLLWVHDEVQLAVRPEIADRVCVILVEEIRKLTDVYGWRVALDGEAKIGANWKETH